MKKLMLRLSVLAVLIMPITSCKEDKNEPKDEAQLSSSEQKEKLEETGKELISILKAADFENVKKLVTYFNEHYTDYDNDQVLNWFDDAISTITSPCLKDTIESDTAYYYAYYYDDYDYVDTYIYNRHNFDYDRIYQMSNFKGNFEAKNGKWEYTDAENLQFIFTDQNNQKCIAKITTSGKSKRIKADKRREQVFSEYFREETENGSTTIIKEQYDIISNYFYLPENINISFVQGGKTIMSYVIQTDLSSISGEEFDYTKDKLTMKTKMTINGYEFIIDKAKYTNSGASLSFSIKKDTKNLISVSVSNEGTYNSEDPEFAKANISVDIMGKMQIKGSCTNCSKYIEYRDKAYKNEENEENFKSYINKANDLLDLSLYYNSGIKQAFVKLEPFENNSWNYKYWFYEPVLVFEDGTKYSTFESFFNKNDFKSLIDIFNKTVDDYKRLINE